MWTLILVLQLGTPQMHEVIAARRLPDWGACIERAISELRVRRGPVAVRCERSAGERA